jgi:metal-responsive CopG/Arc/MetJ family transcriptional regulator
MLEDSTVAKIKLDDNLYARVKKVAEVAGYTSPEEFIVHLIEKELSTLESAESDAEITERLRGLGYIE